MYGSVKDEIAATLQEIEDAGLYKNERELTSPQSAHVTTLKAEALNFCANNYLGLADDPAIIEAAKAALDDWGFGMASVRFICGTQTLHTDLERTISEFLGTEATILYSSCFDANGGVFEVLFGAEDAIISDELNHASIIDGVRLSKAMRYRYKNADMTDLRAQLEAARDADARRTVVVTDGVFSMDGSYAPLDEICDLVESSAEKRETLKANTALFHSLMTEAGFELLPGTHPIRPVMFPGEDGARQAAQIADHMLGNGVYVIAFSFPVVPRGKARIRVQLSAAHSEADVRACVDAFVAARDAVG